MTHTFLSENGKFIFSPPLSPCSFGKWSVTNTESTQPDHTKAIATFSWTESTYTITRHQVKCSGFPATDYPVSEAAIVIQCRPCRPVVTAAATALAGRFSVPGNAQEQTWYALFCVFGYRGPFPRHTNVTKTTKNVSGDRLPNSSCHLLAPWKHYTQTYADFFFILFIFILFFIFE